MTGHRTTYDLLATNVNDLGERNPTRPEGVAAVKLFDSQNLRVISLVIDAGATLREHVAGHPVLIQVVAGTVRIDFDDDSFTLGPGGLIRCDSHAVHEVHAGDEPARLILTMTPSTGTAAE